MENLELEKYILSLEKELLMPQTRKNTQRLQELLAKDFYEFCSSGYVYYYNPMEVITEAPNSESENWEISDFKMKTLSDQTILVTYQLYKPEKSAKEQFSLRNSIWQNAEGGWKMIFHQGTIKRLNE